MNTRVVLRFQPGISQTQVDFFNMMKCALLNFPFFSIQKYISSPFQKSVRSAKRMKKVVN